MHLKDLFNYGKININYTHSKARWPPDFDLLILVFPSFYPKSKIFFSGKFLHQITMFFNLTWISKHRFTQVFLCSSVRITSKNLPALVVSETVFDCVVEEELSNTKVKR